MVKEYALLFPGQGSQYVGMGREIYQRYAIVRELYKEAEELLNIELAKLCFEGSFKELTKTANTQPAILVTSVAMFKVFMEERETLPLFAAGHSLGEISALACSGVISFSDAVKAVRRRGILMQEALSSSAGGMYAISGLTKEQVEEFLQTTPSLKDRIVVSNHNSPKQVTISGFQDALELAARELESRNSRVMKLKVSAPFHSPLMQPAFDQFRKELQSYSFNKFLFPVISNVTARPYTDSINIADHLALQMLRPVLWKDSMQFLNRNGISTIIDVGPQTIVKNLAVENVPGITTFALDKKHDRDSIQAWFMQSYGQSNYKTEPWIRRFVTQCLTESVCTKNNNWNEVEYQNGVLIPIERLQQILSQYQQTSYPEKPEDAREALELLKLVMKTKKVPATEQSMRIKFLLANIDGDILKEKVPN
ncbi:ACP S-malonyltransferase [Bacillus atrophaeus]|uniref:ACP S-malonyltransferase n=1 Tax=Bacillus atrophaeus TaxID=1452 RepID=UPI00227DA9A4|nr:ACP S-malonyltransferase [Bacillus atrophaeus]MCY8823356.1 ACP S-malonyltransferase [Bacillus atrophaeus]